MNKRKYLYVTGAVLLLVLIAYFIFSKSDKQQLITVKVKKGSFPIEVTTTGELIAKSADKIPGPQNMMQMRMGQVKIQHIIPDGTVVKAGDYVATLDKTDLTNRIKDEEANVDKYLTTLLTTKLDTTLEMSEQREKLLDLNYTMTEKKIALDQSVYETPATQRQYRNELEKAERTFDQATKSYSLILQQKVAKMKEATAAYTQAKRKLDQLKDLEKQFTIRAPKAGMVIYRRDEYGNKMGINSIVTWYENVVAELPDLSEMISKTFVNEIDISKVKVGQAVRVGIDAFPEKNFTGKVIDVANIGGQQMGSNAKLYEVRILLNEFDSVLRPAMTTNNTILTDVIDNALSLPMEAVFSNDSMNYVFKKDGNRIIRQQVILGKSNDNEIVILAGLDESDEVYLVQPENSDDLKLNLLAQELIEKFRPKPLSGHIHKGIDQDSLNLSQRDRGLKQKSN